MRPAPKVGVGMRKIMSPACSASEKLGCGRTQLPASLRSADREQVFHSAVGITGIDGAVRIEEERKACFPSWAIGGDEIRSRVFRGDWATGKRELRVGRSACPANCGLRVTGTATIRIESRSQADVRRVRDLLHFLEAGLTVGEKRQEAVRVAADNGCSGAAVATLHSGVGLSECHSREEQHCQNQ